VKTKNCLYLRNGSTNQIAGNSLLSSEIILMALITHPLVLARILLVTLSRRKNFNFSALLFYMKGNQTRFVESSDSYIKKLVTNAVLESTKKSTK